jgi:hypothetical protein
VPASFCDEGGYSCGTKGWEIITRRSARVTFHKVNDNDNWNQTFRYKLILFPTLSRKLKTNSHLPRKDGPPEIFCGGWKEVKAGPPGHICLARQLKNSCGDCAPALPPRWPTACGSKALLFLTRHLFLSAAFLRKPRASETYRAIVGRPAARDSGADRDRAFVN